ncbi:MAG: hypothetical protein P8Y66_05525 [Nitrospirota bacterium]|jgi:hypothetical protein
MAEESKKTPQRRPREPEQKHEELPHPGHDEQCRCEEAKGKSVPEFLKLVVEDLKFWKKKGGSPGR